MVCESWLPKGRNIVIDWWYGNGSYDSHPEAAIREASADRAVDVM